jgi:hypothetical protein
LNLAVASTTQLTATLAIASGAAAGARNVTVTNSVGGSGTLAGGFTVVSAAPASLALTYNGLLRDRVGQDNTALAPDGALDGTLTATLSAAGGRTVTGLRLDSNAPGIWDTSNGTAYWALAVAPTLDGAVLNASGTMAVNFLSPMGKLRHLPPRTIRARSSCRSDPHPHRDLADGSAATAVTTVPWRRVRR